MTLSVNRGDVGMKVYSAVVSQVVDVGFHDLAKVADKLPGQELA